jgi:hypothetical protein
MKRVAKATEDDAQQDYAGWVVVSDFHPGCGVATM